MISNKTVIIIGILVLLGVYATWVVYNAMTGNQD